MRTFILFLFFSVICSGISLPARSQDLSGTKPKIGLVLSGGGAKGLAHIGVLKILEKTGIRPDFIGGTSMGGIIGGLYAIGYSADSLEHLARTLNWNYYLGDEIPRREITIEEKEDFDRFVLSFQIKDNKIQIPTGVINGQNLENLFNKLCAPVHEIRDFNQFDIPFLCIATNIETGKEVVLREGYLPNALRATMSIPSIFNPVEINNQLLVDGGLVNNLPANHVKEMGADIIIGVDVGFHSVPKSELTTIFKIIEQSVSFLGEELNFKNKKICDILISPNLNKYNVSSFNSSDSIIAIGERAARDALPKLQALADSLNLTGRVALTDQRTSFNDSILINEILFTGLKRVSPKLVSGKLELYPLQKITPADIEKAINRVYSSLYFEKVTYEIQKNENGTSLILNLKEYSGGLFRVGMHYDSYNHASILLNTTFRNFVLSGSKLSVSTGLGENPYFRACVLKNNGWKPGYGLNFESNSSEMYTYDNSRKVSAYNYYETKLQLFTQSIIRNSYSMGLGIERENSKFKPIIDPTQVTTNKRSSFTNYYVFMNIDSYDHAFYPSKGLKLRSELKLVTSSKNYSPILFMACQFSSAHKIIDRINIITRITGGNVTGDSIPPQYMFYTGGLTENMRNGLMPFVGLDYMERANKNAIITGLDVQIRFWKNVFVILRGNVGNLTDNPSQLLSLDNLINGYGITAGYNSLIGPIEFSASRSMKQRGMHGFLRVGFYF